MEFPLEALYCSVYNYFDNETRLKDHFHLIFISLTYNSQINFVYKEILWYVFVCDFLGVFISACTCRGPNMTSVIFLCSSLPHFARRGLSLNLKLIFVALLAGQKGLCNPPISILPPHHWVTGIDCHTWLSHACWKLKLRSSCVANTLHTKLYL